MRYWLVPGVVVVVFVAMWLAGCATPQERMKYCNETAGKLKGDARQAHMKECLKG